MSVLEQLKEKNRQNQRQANVKFDDLARRIAAGNDDPSLEEAEEILAAAGKTTSDLSKRASYHQHRNNQRAKIAAADEARVEIKKVEAEVEAADAELVAARQKHLETIVPLQARLDVLRQVRSAAHDLDRKLREECDDEVACERIGSLDMHISICGHSIEQLDEQIQRLARQIKGHKERGEYFEPLDEQLADCEEKKSVLLAEWREYSEERGNLYGSMIDL